VRKTYREGATFVVLVGLYLAGNAYAVHFAKGPSDFALFWPSAGLTLAVVVRYGLRWAFFVPVAMSLDFLLRMPSPPRLGEAGAGFSRFASGRRNPRRELRGLVGALFGVAGMLLGGLLHKDAVPDALLRWSMGDLLGVTTVTPALILFAYRHTKFPGFDKSEEIALEGEALVWNVALAASFLLMAWGAAAGGLYPLGLSSLPLAVMVWSALRFEPLRTAIAVALTVGLIGSFTGMGLTGFEPPARTLDCVMLLSYLCVLSVLPITLALVVNESRVATRQATR